MILKLTNDSRLYHSDKCLQFIICFLRQEILKLSADDDDHLYKQSYVQMKDSKTSRTSYLKAQCLTTADLCSSRQKYNFLIAICCSLRE